MNTIQILEKIATPRPNHGETVKQTADFIKNLLSSWNLPFVAQEFWVREHQTLMIGATFVILSILFFLLIKAKKSFLATVCISTIFGVIVLETEYSVHVVSPPFQRLGENIVINFNVPKAEKELIFAAHYDSKTDIWDHNQRAIFLKLMPFTLLLGFLISALTFAGNRYRFFGKKIFRIFCLVTSAALVIFSLFTFSWLGGYIFLDEQYQSPGAIDDGASVAALLTISRAIHRGELNIDKSNITILLTDAEEVGFQGAYHYVKTHFGEKPSKLKKPVYLINLELVGQGGSMFYMENSLALLRVYPTSIQLNERLKTLWQELSQTPAVAVKSGMTDSFPFSTIGIPSATIGNTGVPGLGFSGFHSPQDNMTRVDPKNLSLMIQLLKRFIESF